MAAALLWDYVERYITLYAGAALHFGMVIAFVNNSLIIHNFIGGCTYEQP